MSTLRVAIVGAGPAGLYAALRLAQSRLRPEIAICEQNPPGATFGFGVAFSERALGFLAAEDPDTLAALRPELETWSDSIVVHRGRTVRIDGMGYAGIARLRLLHVLEARARAAGVRPAYGEPVRDVDALDADLVIGADGVNSVVRRRFESEFQASVTHGSNRYAWYGTTRRFEALSHTFVETSDGHFNAHHHPHGGGMSTFVVEMDEATFARAGFETMDEEESRLKCEAVFAETLGGHGLLGNKSIWRRFPRVRSGRWSAGRCVLIGDAAHTAHFSIGSGTRLAMEDAVALVKALEAQPGDVAGALAAYEAARRPAVEKLLAAADASAAWYERFAAHMTLSPMEFAMSYITRSGRMDRERLRSVAPAFLAEYESETANRGR